MKKTIITLATISIIGAANMFAYSSHGNTPKGACGGDMSRGNNPMMMLKSMDLSDKQQDALFKIMQEKREAMYKMKKENAPVKMSAYVKDGKFSKAAYIKDATQQSQKMLEFKANNFEKVYNILTDEQKKTFLEKMDSKKDFKKGDMPQDCSK